jgi:hypothetical protein
MTHRLQTRLDRAEHRRAQPAALTVIIRYGDQPVEEAWAVMAVDKPIPGGTVVIINKPERSHASRN